MVHRSFASHGTHGWSNVAIEKFMRESSPPDLTSQLRSAFLALVAYSGPYIIGFVLMPTPSVLSMLFVDPDHFRQGIGRDLWLACVARLDGDSRAAGVVSLNSTAAAIPFYLSLGFVAQGGEFERGGCRATRMQIVARLPPGHEV